MLTKLFNKRQRGDEAERNAERYLIKHGLKLVERNYRTRFGEIDLIMQDGEALVFVEVRLRKNQDFGGAAASIGEHKQRRIIAAAQGYLATMKHPPPCRLDAVLLAGAGGADVEWLKNAFSL
jgi:putative endonuclease